MPSFGRKKKKTPLGRYTCKWEGNIKMVLKEKDEGV
jgi:hypothetical protein